MSNGPGARSSIEAFGRIQRHPGCGVLDELEQDRDSLGPARAVDIAEILGCHSVAHLEPCRTTQLRPLRQLKDAAVVVDSEAGRAPESVCEPPGDGPGGIPKLVTWRVPTRRPTRSSAFRSRILRTQPGARRGCESRSRSLATSNHDLWAFLSTFEPRRCWAASTTGCGDRPGREPLFPQSHKVYDRQS